MKSPTSKIPTSWIYTGTAVTIGAMLMIGIWYFVVKQRQATAALAHNQEALLAHVEELEALMGTSIRKANACKDEIDDMSADMELSDEKIAGIAENIAGVAENTASIATRIQSTNERTQAIVMLNQRLLIESCNQNREHLELIEDVFTEIYKQKLPSQPLAAFKKAMDDAVDFEDAAAIAMKAIKTVTPTRRRP